jgi:hypothetical protein
VLSDGLGDEPPIEVLRTALLLATWSRGRSDRGSARSRSSEAIRVADVIPESVDSSQTFYLLGTIVLIIGVVAGLTSLLIRRRLEEAHRDERYVRERRGEKVGPVEYPRVVGALQSAGVSIAAVGILLLVAGWTLAPGPS